jgi:hypothetical protein
MPDGWNVPSCGFGWWRGFQKSEKRNSEIDSKKPLKMWPCIPDFTLRLHRLSCDHGTEFDFIATTKIFEKLVLDMGALQKRICDPVKSELTGVVQLPGSVQTYMDMKI